MPELPEVEFARRCLERWAKGKQITAVAVHERRVVGGGPALTSLRRARFQSFDRRGKHLMVTLRQGDRAVGLWSHLGMTGKWLLRDAGDEPPRFTRVALTLAGDKLLCYVDLRLFGRLRVVKGAAFDAVPTLSALGPDPLHDGVDVDRLAQRFARSKTPIKVALMDQRLLAGIGNIQASEALFRARLDPRRAARTLTVPELRRLKKGIDGTLAYTLTRFTREVSARRGRDIRYVEEPDGPNPFKVYGRGGEPCPRGHGPLTRLVQAGRSTFFCASCQS